MKRKTLLACLLLFVFTQVYLFLSNMPLILRSQKTAPDRIFTLINFEWAHDYNLYLSAVNQGQRGSWLYTDTYTSEETNPGIFYLYFTAVGKIGKIFNLPVTLSYQIARLLSTELFILGVFLLNYLFLGKIAATLGVIFSLAANPFFFLLFTDPLLPPPKIPWWSDFEALERLNGLPHHLFGQALLLFSLFFFFSYLKRKKLGFLLLSLITLIAGGIIFPPILAPLGTALPLAFIYIFIKKYFRRKRILLFPGTALISCLLIIFTAFLVLGIIKWQETQGFPWHYWTDWNMSRWNRVEMQINQTLPFILGILPLFTLPAAYRILKKGPFADVFLVFWAFLPILLLPLADLLLLPKMRLLQAAPFVPLSMLAALSLTRYFPFQQIEKLFQYSLIILFLFFTLPVTFRAFFWKWDYIRTQPAYGLVYPEKKVYQALLFLDRAAAPGAIVFSNEFVGNLFPVFTGTRAYFGHLTLTKDFFVKKDRVFRFYTGLVPEAEAKQFMKDNNIRYIYSGADEKVLLRREFTYLFLKKIYTKEDIDIYEVIK